MRLLTFLCCFLAIGVLSADDKPRFRTDADGPVVGDQRPKGPKNKRPNDKPEWYQLVEGQFPPEGSAHAVSGELIRVDHLLRRVTIRVDRNDSQERGVWDLPSTPGCSLMDRSGITERRRRCKTSRSARTFRGCFI